MAAIDIREENDPLRDASRPYGQASADENALRALASVGEGSALQAPARGRKVRDVAPPDLQPLVNDDAVITPPGARPLQSLDGFEVGGMGQKYPFMAANELTDKALLQFPPAVQAAFRNRRIERPRDIPERVYGQPMTAGGYYDPESRDIVLARGNNTAYGNPNIDVGGLQHEILHAISYEGQFFSQDREAGYPELRSAFAEALPTLMANPQTTRGATEATARFADDPDHAFTALGDLYVQGLPLPHALEQYFDQMRAYRALPQALPEDQTDFPPRPPERTAAPTPRGTPTGAPEAPYKPTPGQFDVRNILPTLGEAKDMAGTTANRWLRSGAASAEQGWNDIVQGFGPAIKQLMTPVAVSPASEDPSAVIGRPVGGALGIVGSPFTATAETARVAMVQNVPELNSVYEQALAQVPKTTLTDPAAIERERATNEAAAAQLASTAGRTTLFNGAKDPSLPFETRLAALTGAALLGAETAAEFGAPSALYRIPAAFRSLARWNLSRALHVAEDAPAEEATQLRLDALNKASADLNAQERAAAAALGVGEEQGPLAAKVAGGQNLLRVSKEEALGEQAKANDKIASTNQVSSNALLKQGIEERTRAALAANPAVSRNLGDVLNERLRVNALRSDILGERVPVLTAEDEQKILAGIQATHAEIAPQLEARTQNLGDVMTTAAKNAERSMWSALRRATTEGETLRLRNVTVGADAEGKAVRLRQLVGTFDRAIQTVRATAEQSGRTAEAETLLAPFNEARRSAMESLQAAEAYNAAIKRNVTLASQDYRAASKAATAAKQAEDKAYAATTRTGQKAAKAEASVGAQAEKQAQRTETAVEALQARVDAAKSAAADAAQSVKLRVGGDTAPETAHAGTGYVAPDVAEVWARNRLHTGTFDDPLVGEAMAAWVKANPGAVDNAEHSWQQFTSSISSLTGADIERVQRAIPRTGELTRTMYVAEQVFGQLVKEWRSLGQAAKEGAVDNTALVDKTTQVMAFEDALRRGIGEQGRALAARNLVKKADAVQVLAANEKVRLSYAQVERLAKQIDNLQGKVAAAEGKGDGLALTAARQSLEQSLTDFAAAKDQLTEARAASAAAADEVYKMALRKAVAQGATKDTAAVLAKFDPEDIVGIAAFLRSLKPQGLGALVMRAAMAGRYGKIPSNIQNFMGNGMNALFQEALVRPVTAVTAPIASKLSGVEKIRASNETASAWLGMWGASPDAARYFARTLWEGNAAEIGLKYGITDYQTLIGTGLESGNPAFRIAGHTFELSGPKAIPIDVTLRALYGADGFIRILFAGGDRNALAALKAFRAGEGAKGAVQAVAGEMTLIEREAVLKEGLIKSFNEPILHGPGGNIVEQFEQHFMAATSVNVGGFAPLRLAIPAARFGMRNIETGLRYSGGGLITGTRLAMRARDTGLTNEARTMLARQGMREMAEGAVGASLLITGFGLAATGLTTGAYPTSAAERTRWATLGIQPMSFKVGDHYIPMGWFGPLSAPFALSALIHDASVGQEDASLWDRIERGAQGLGQYVMQQPAFYATKALVEAVYNAAQGSFEQMNTILSQIAVATSVGSLAQSMTAVFDPYQRDPEGFIQRLYSRYPGLSTTVPPKIDQRTGKPLERMVSGPGALLATDLGTANDISAVQQETLGTPIGTLSKTITSGTASVKLSQDQFKAYEQNARQKAAAAAEKIIASAAYKSVADPAGRQAMLKAAYDRAGAEARSELAASLVASAKTPDEVFNATVVSRTALPEYQYVLMVGSLVAQGKLTPDVAKRVDDSRAAHPDGTRDPAVAELRAAAPQVRQYMQIKPFLRGGDAEWQQVQQQRAELAAIRASNVTRGQAAVDAAVRAYISTHPLLSVYDNGAMTNPARKAFLDAHPAIKTLVGGSDWEWLQ